jgi:short-chain 2-methylacyl-CoA dehydrogenase
MYDLTLTPEQLEFRDTVRDFVTTEVKPAALDPKRLEPFEKPLLANILEKASQMGLRTLALSEEAGGAGADGLTSCIVMEELGAGDVDLASVLAHTSTLAGILFDRLMTPAQRARLLPKFVDDDRYHLACAGREPGAGVGWSYHRPLAAEAGAEPAASRQGNDWVINGTLPFVANATVAKLFAVQVRTDPKKSGMNGLSTLLVPRETAGLTVRDPFRATGDSVRWHHGAGAGISFKDCRVPADHLLGKESSSPLALGAELTRGVPHHIVARVYTAEAVNEVALLAAECFGAMGVMRDMPLQKYVHDSMVFLHSDDADGAAKLAVAESISGYQRPAAAA